MKIIILFLLFSVLDLFAQQLQFEFDYARFFINDTISRVEFYYQFDKTGLKKKTTSDSVKVNLNLKLTSKSDNSHIVRNFIVNDKFDTASVSKASVGQFNLYLKPAKYLIEIKATDGNNSANSVIKIDTLNLEKSHKLPFLSDIELAYRIQKKEKNNSPFYKNTYEIIPNPGLVFTYLHPEIYYYYELYSSLDIETTDLITVVELFSGNGEKVYSVQKSIPGIKGSIAKVGQINLSEFQSDSYILRISLIDTTGKFAYSTLKKFFYINPNIKAKDNYAVVPVSDIKFGGLSETECDLLFKKVRYIASSSEKELYEKLKTVKQKQRFFSDFWKRHDKNPLTPQNEYMDEYFKRMKYVNEKFKTKTKPGYLTDRGRVYLLYGEPDEIDRYPYSLNTKPYELWYYNTIEGGVVFVFGDLTGVGDYYLLHSTKRGEKYDANWRERIRAF